MHSRIALLHCNADVQTGMGHFMRCLAIAEEALRRGWRVVVAGRLGERSLTLAEQLIPGARIEQIGSAPPRAALERLVRVLGPDVVHIDSYDRALDGLSLEGALISNAQDGEFGRRPADLPIDANLFAEERWRSERSAPPLIGADAVQVRAQVRRVRHRVRSPLTDPLRVLLTLGGTDPGNLTPLVARAIVSAGTAVQLTAVCREEQHPEVREACATAEHPPALVAFATDLPGLADEHDLVVTAAGTSTWDFAAMGIPMGLICAADNQEQGYAATERARFAIPLGTPPHHRLQAAVEEGLVRATRPDELETLALRGREIVDGLGVWRVVAAWEQLLAVPPQASSPSPRVEARPVALDDAQTLYAWRNDPRTRAFSRSGEEIEWEAHLAWLARSLQSADRQLLVVEREGEAIGTVRWDRLGGASWEVSITASPDVRGLGYAAAILRAAEEALVVDGAVQLVAVVNDDNLPSRRLFARAGYLPHRPADERGFASFAKWRLRSDPT